MESYPNPSLVHNEALQQEKDVHLHVLKASDNANGTALTEVFLDQYTEVDVSSESEWLSNFVEDCLSSGGNCLLPTKEPPNLIKKSPIHSKALNPRKKALIPVKPRSQRGRKRATAAKKIPLFKWPDDHNFQSGFSDPPLLEQGYWLADSELLSMPRKQEIQQEMKVEKGNSEEEEDDEEKEMQQPRKCSHCQAQKTPQWRAGPLGPKTLCNACGMRYFKSGRLLPEYRPAKSPTFVSYKHSNSHKKVLQMRMGSTVSSSTPIQQ